MVKYNTGDKMQKTRSELRENIMTILYQKNIYDHHKMNYDIDDVMKEVVVVDNEFVKEIVYGVITYQKEIDALANHYLKDWTIERLGNTDSAILRMGIYELMYTQTPPVVAINEAILLSKKYSDDDVRKMINSVLDRVYHEKVDGGK